MENNELDRLRAGDDALWRRINKTCRENFISLTAGHDGCHLQDSEDAFQNAVAKFFILLLDRRLLSLEKNVSHMLFRCYINCFIDIKRKRSGLQEIYDVVDHIASCDDDINSDLIVDRESRSDMVNSILHLLNKNERKLFDLLIKGYTIAAIVKKLKLKSTNTAIQRRLRLIDKIRSLIGIESFL